MFMRKMLLSALIAAGTIGGVATPLPSVAAANVDIQLNFGPPPLRYEAVPAPRSGYVWSPGHWAWDGRGHVWVAGHWVTARPGYAYYAPGWVERDGRWYYRSSRWDRDGDGIPNRRDPTPNGFAPRHGDRDGDGVPNRYDSHPDNPYRR
jgi:hypothetical protein